MTQPLNSRRVDYAVASNKSLRDLLSAEALAALANSGDIDLTQGERDRMPRPYLMTLAMNHRIKLSIAEIARLSNSMRRHLRAAEVI